MQLFNSIKDYGAIPQTLHWLTVFLLRFQIKSVTARLPQRVQFSLVMLVAADTRATTILSISTVVIGVDSAPEQFGVSKTPSSMAASWIALICLAFSGVV